MMKNVMSSRLSLLIALFSITTASLVGCAPRDQPEIKKLDGNLTMKSDKDVTEIIVDGSDREKVIQIRREEVLDSIKLPAYPNARIIPGSEKCIITTGAKDRTCSVKYRSTADYGDIVHWYQTRLNQKPISAKLLGVRTAIFTLRKPASTTRTVTVTYRKGAPDTDIQLVSFVKGEQ